MSSSSSEPRVFGFTQSEWVRSGAFTQEHFQRIVGSMALGEQITFTSAAWITLAGLGPDYARKVWAQFGDNWIAQLHRLRDRVTNDPPAVGGPEVFDRPLRYVARNIRELRRLAALPELELPD